MKLKTLSILTAFAIVLSGCTGSKSEPVTSASPATPPPDTTTKPAATEDKGAAKPQPLSDVPQALVTDAYRYYGLSNPKPLKMESNDKPKLTGTIETQFLGVKNGKATFRQTWTGDLSNYGVNDLSVDDTGIYTTSAFDKPLSAPAIELPTNLSVGSSWKVNTDFDLPDGRKVHQEGTDTIVGMKDITIGKRTYPTIEIEEKGSFSVDGKKNETVMRKWLSKDIGPVKLMIEATQGGKPVTKTLQVAE